MKNDPIRERIKNRKEDEKNKLYENLGLYYTLNSALGIHGVNWYWLIGSRGRGKSYAVVETYLKYVKKYGQENCRCYYFRISDLSIKAMLSNKGAKAIDAKLVREYKLDITTKGTTLYNRGKPLMYFYPLVSAAKAGKGVAEYDPDFLGECVGTKKRRFIFIVLDEFMMAEGVEKKSVGSPVDQFKIYMENILRDQEQLDYPAVKFFGCANTVSECSDFLAQVVGFVPEKPGRYVLKRKHMLVDNIPNSKAYEEKRKKSFNADIMDYEGDANYTNELKRDLQTLVKKGRHLNKVTAIIKFDKYNTQKWYTLWDSKIIKSWNGQQCKNVIGMKRYLDTQYNQDIVRSIFEMYDARAFLYTDLITQACFSAELKLIKK